MLTVTCYKNKQLPVGFVDNSYEADILFTGIVIDNGTEKKSLTCPLAITYYGADDVVIKDLYGKSYYVEPDDTQFGNKTLFVQFLRTCLDSVYTDYFNMTGQTFITLDYDLTDIAAKTADEINGSINIFGQGALLYTDKLALSPATNNKYLIELPNKVHFNRAQTGRMAVLINGNYLHKP